MSLEVEEFSYILYLTEEWKPEWGGALRLYPTNPAPDSDVRIPTADWSVVIPPACNQLSFFAVQPGFSFHDVEEVTKDGKVRMAISGWFHIPQRGEEGFIKGLEEELAAKSSLQQLQSKSEKYDLPQPGVVWYYNNIEDANDEEDDGGLTEEDCTFLLQYINPTYLVPDTLDQMSELFADESSVQLANILSNSFSSKLKEHILKLDSVLLSDSAAAIPVGTPNWLVSSPPHKARFLYYQPETISASAADDPLSSLLHNLLPSKAFKKFLQLATGVNVINRDLLARRFRPGMDYTLAKGYDEPKPRVEVTLGLTPTIGGWEEASEDDEETSEEVEEVNGDTKGKGKAKAEPVEKAAFESWGGYEVYMTGDEDEQEAKGGKKSDPAVYKGAADDEEDDGVLFSMPASWNKMSIVYRDTGVLRFVKYVSKAAKGSRWDVGGVWEVEDDNDDNADDLDDDDNEETNGMAVIEEEDEDEEEAEASGR